MSEKKIKILTISDHPLVASGVGTQTRYIIEGLLKTGRYTVRSLGAAIRHEDYRPIRIAEYGEDWMIHPIDGYGDPEIVREVLDEEKPDVLWFMTDPRFYVWLYAMSDEVRDRGVPLLYYHVWDNHPVPKFNKVFYDSCDYVGCISKLTHDILIKLGCGNKSGYIPHAVDADIFKPLPLEQIRQERVSTFGAPYKDKFIVFYNSRNARRKMTSDVLKAFKSFSNIVGNDKTFLFMHTDPHDPEGANLLEVASMLDLQPGQIMFSKARVDSPQVAKFYNMADVTMNISNNEGFGLSCLESLSCGTPVIVNETGGLQDQVKDEKGFQFGVSVKPVCRSLQGSQQIPYIYDDRCADIDYVEALLKMYNMTFEERKALGQKGRDYTLRAFNMNDMIGNWDKAIMKYVEEYRKGNPNRVKVAKI